MKTKWKQDYYKISDVAKFLDCEAGDIINFGVNNKLRIAAYANLDTSEFVQSFNDDANGKVLESGYYYIYCNQLKAFEYYETKNIHSSYIKDVNSTKDEIKIFFDSCDAIENFGKLSLGEELDSISDEAIKNHEASYNLNSEYDIPDVSDDVDWPGSAGSANIIGKNSSNTKTNEVLNIHSKALVINHDDLEHFIQNEWAHLQKNKLSVRKHANTERSKEINSLLVMVIAMAQKYDYDHKANKSGVPLKIVTDIEKLGLKLNIDTVRNWLDKSSNLLDQNENS